MRTVLAVSFVLTTFVSGAYAQRGGGSHGGGGGGFQSSGSSGGHVSGSVGGGYSGVARSGGSYGGGFGAARTGGSYGGGFSGGTRVGGSGAGARAGGSYGGTYHHGGTGGYGAYRTPGYRGYGRSRYGYVGLGFYGGYPYGPTYASWPYYNGYSDPYPAYDPYASSYDYAPVYSGPAEPEVRTVYVERASPVTHIYNEYGEERGAQSAGSTTGVVSSEPPIYLIALQGQVIHPAIAYWAEGTTLHYVTLDHEQKTAPISSVDCKLSSQLNHERGVAFQLP